MYDTSISSDLIPSDVMPVVCGFKIIILVLEVAEKTEGGIIRPDQLRTLEETASIMGLVVKMGPDAYSDEEKFPSGPYCKAGDWVMFRSYTGTRYRQREQEFRILNDDQIEAVVPDPREITRK